MKKIVVEGTFPSLNQFIDANRQGRGNWNKGNTMKQRDQAAIIKAVIPQLRTALRTPIFIEYTFYEKNRRRDLDNVSGYFHKVFQDALVECGRLSNDGWSGICGFSDRFYVDTKRPRVEITIKEKVNE